MRENLKNVLLFMASSEFLVPPSQDTSKEKLWDETWNRVDRFLPDLRGDIFPPVDESESKQEEEPKAEDKTGVESAEQLEEKKETRETDESKDDDGNTQKEGGESEKKEVETAE